MTVELRSICVYCGSSPGDSPVFQTAAEQLGRAAAKTGVRIVYGGGSVGLMGALAKTAHQAGGDVLGIIPQFLVAKEGILEGVEHRIVDTMHERKMIMFEESDAFAVLPGGIGTLEEVVETLSWSRLQLHAKPVILVNIENFWAPFVDLIDHCIGHGFAPPWFRDHVLLADKPEDVAPLARAKLASMDAAVEPASVE